MYPVLFRIGSFEVTSFGAMLGLAALAAVWLFRRELGRSGLPVEAADAGLVGVIGGLVGAKLLWTLEHSGQAPVADLLFSRGGLSWYGGLMGGVGSGLAFIITKGWPVVPLLAAATPALALGHLIGRIGCFLVGDDYGTPSTLPWAVAFPNGLPPTTTPVHPTQLYEAAALGVLTWLLLRWRRQRLPDLDVLGRYFMGAGLIRFGIDFLRVNVRVALGLSVAHWISLVVIGVGMLLLFRAADRRRSVNPGIERGQHEERQRRR
jgi:phosphatidylglycerol:prolipoprotein diacylglycerol transferase